MHNVLLYCIDITKYPYQCFITICVHSETKYMSTKPMIYNFGFFSREFSVPWFFWLFSTGVSFTCTLRLVLHVDKT